MNDKEEEIDKILIKPNTFTRPINEGKQTDDVDVDIDVGFDTDTDANESREP